MKKVDPHMLAHADLIPVATDWLKKVHRCSIVLHEMHTAAWSVPDAIGWRARRSFFVECKASRNDFLKDKKKPHHRAARCPGMYRYYLTLPGIVRVEELPGCWGLAEFDGQRVVTVKPAVYSRDRCFDEEMAMLCSVIKRSSTDAQLKRIWVKQGVFADMAKSRQSRRTNEASPSVLHMPRVAIAPKPGTPQAV